MAKIQTTIYKRNQATQTLVWEGDEYNDDPYGEAVATLLNDDPNMTHNRMVVLYTKTGEVLEYVKLDYETREEAEAMEDEFRGSYQPARNKWNVAK